MLKRKEYKAEGILCFFIFIAYVLFNSSFWGWHGGWAFGPRFMILSIPFLAVAAGALWLPHIGTTSQLETSQGEDKRISKSIIYENIMVKNSILIVTVIFSIFMMFMVTAVNPMLSQEIFSPLDPLVYGISHGKFVPTLGKLMGLNGWLVFVPMILFLVGTGFWLSKSAKAS